MSRDSALRIERSDSFHLEKVRPVCDQGCGFRREPRSAPAVEVMVAQRTMRYRKLARNYPMQEFALVTSLNDTTELAHRGLDPDTLRLDYGIGVYHFIV